MPRTSFSVHDVDKPSYASRGRRWKDLNELPDNHWRKRASKKYVDYSKRTLKNPWCVSEENILSTTRRRKRVNYNENNLFPSDVANEDFVKTHTTRVSRASKRGCLVEKMQDCNIENISRNTLEQREKVRNNMELAKKIAPKTKVREEKLNPEDLACKDEVMDQSFEGEVEETKDDLMEESTPLSHKVMQQIERLNGSLPMESEPRPYLDYSSNMPQGIQCFCDIQWNHPCFMSKEFDIEIEFAGEFALDRSELADVSLLKDRRIKQDYILVGDGTTLIVMRNNDHSDDPVVYMAPDGSVMHESYNKALRLSEFLSKLEVDRDQIPTMFEEEEQ